jgi:zinc transport system ATP-binding protein
MESIVSLKNVSVRYEDYMAIEGVNLDIYADDFICIIGPNGGGKTTLIKAILGTIPHSGEVTLSSTLFNGNKRLIGYLPQQSTFDRNFPISVLEVVMSGLQGDHGFTSRYNRTDKEKALQLLNRVGIADIADRQISEISCGQMQRVLLCRAVIAEPKLLILDEPSNFIDKRFESELYNILQELNKQMAIIMVSHDVNNISPAVKSIVCVNRTLHRHNTNTLSHNELREYCSINR